MLKAFQIMSRNVISSKPTELASEAFRKMHTHHIKHLPIVDGQELKGIVTLLDLLLAAKAGDCESMDYSRDNCCNYVDMQDFMCTGSNAPKIGRHSNRNRPA